MYIYVLWSFVLCWTWEVWSLRWLTMQLWVNDKYRIAKISQSRERGVPNHCLTDLFHQTETGRCRNGARSDNGKIPNYHPAVMMDNDSFGGDCDWDGLWFSTGSGGKQLKAEIISKTIRTRDCGQMVTVKQADRNSEYSVSRICLLVCWNFKSI